MVEQFKKIIEQIAEKEVSVNANVNNDLASNVARETGNSLIEGLKSAVSSGNMTEIMALVNAMDVKRSRSNAEVKNNNNMQSLKLTNNEGIQSTTFYGVATAIIPQLIRRVFIENGRPNIKPIL